MSELSGFSVDDDVGLLPPTCAQSLSSITVAVPAGVDEFDPVTGRSVLCDGAGPGGDPGSRITIGSPPSGDCCAAGGLRKNATRKIAPAISTAMIMFYLPMTTTIMLPVPRRKGSR